MLRVLMILALTFALASSALAQTKGTNLLKDLATKNDVNKVGAGATSSASGPLGTQPEDAIIAKINELGTKLIADLQMARDYASAKGPDGQLADAAAAPCYEALIPVVTLVVNGPTPASGVSPTAAMATELGVVTKVEKLRIIRIALQSTSLRNACAPLVQDVQTQINSVLGMGAGIARVVTGLGLVP